MTDKRDPKDASGKAPAKPARGGLRLVKPEAEVPAVPEAPAKKKSNLVSFMNAYADAIDRDIQALLDL